MIQQPLRVIAGDPEHPLVIGDIKIPCYVLEDETRVITQRGLFQTLEISKGGTKKIDGAQIDNKSPDFPQNGHDNRIRHAIIPRFFQQNWLSPYISRELSMVLKSPIPIIVPTGGIAQGFPATILVDVCKAILQAHSDGRTSQRQSKFVRRAEILLIGFAELGVISLIDEATGYQKVRGDRALAAILEEYIAKELRPWIKTFPDEFYEEIYRLMGREYPPDSKNHPQFIGKITNRVIYKPLAPGVLEDLQKINPVLSSGNRGAKHHQHLTENHGVIKLKEHIAVVVTLMRISSSKEVFDRRFYEAFYDRHMKLPFKEDLDDL